MQTYGNLAVREAYQNLDEQLSALANPAPWQDFSDYQEEMERQRKRDQIAEEKSRLRRAHRVSGMIRARQLLAWLGSILLIAGISGGLLYRQARIFESNFHNTGTVNAIAAQLEENRRASKALMEQSDTSHIEAEALRLFGLRKPSQSQRITMTLPETDKTIFYANSFLGSGKSEGNYKVLEAYMKARQETEDLP